MSRKHCPNSSISWKLTLHFMGIIFLTLFIFGAGISLTARFFSTDQYRKDIKKRVKITAQALGKESENTSKPAGTKLFIETLSNLPGVSVRVIDRSGATIAHSPDDKRQDIGITPQDLQELLNGQDVEMIHPSIHHSDRYYYAASPIISNGKVIGGVMTVISLSLPADIRKRITSAIFKSLLISLLISSIVAHFLSGNITKPIRMMQNTARKIATGDFSGRLKIKRNDEIGVLADAMDNMSEKLENNIKQRLQLTANISHEIRTPLAAIQGCSEAIMDGILDTEEERDRYLKTIRDEAKRISVLLKDLTELSRFETGDIEIEREPFSAGDIIRRAISGVEVFAGKKNIAIKSELPAEEILVSGDSDRILQTLIILLDNAIQHIPDGREIRIILRKSGNSAVFAVADTGDGIPSEDLPHVFERFYKADKSRTRDGSGSGLGLSIAKQIIKTHGGTINVKSSATGSEFWFELPVESC
ncbi:MAG: cell wall metabolism sensor histidine kinase WalK [Firmicutes bacterium]|nr:cell wall metabolism sensor histidine kinase WalK [Bacillota bacterium]